MNPLNRVTDKAPNEEPARTSLVADLRRPATLLSRRALLAGIPSVGLLATAQLPAANAHAQPLPLIGQTKGTNMTFIETKPGVQIYVEDLAPADARATVVFLHGWPVSGRMFEYQTNWLPSQGVRTVSVDLRGYGKSSKPWGPYGYDEWADDLRLVMDSLELRNVTLAGFSMGGAIAMHYMLRHASYGVGRLALLGAAGPCLGQKSDNPLGVPREAHDGFIALALADRAKLNAEFGKLLFNRPTTPEMDRFFWDMGMEASPRATVRGVEELRDRDNRAQLRKIAVPTLICHGVHDQVIPFALGAEMQVNLIKSAKLVRFEQSGHGLFIDEREKLNAELARFALTS